MSSKDTNLPSNSSKRSHEEMEKDLPLEQNLSTYEEMKETQKDEPHSDLKQGYEDFQKLLKTGQQEIQHEIETSQIDPEIIKDMLVNNVLSSIIKLKQSQEEMNDAFLKTKEVVQITGDRSLSKTMDIYNYMSNEIKIYNSIKYLEIEQKALTCHNNGGDIKEAISRSSQTPLTIIDGLMEDNRNKISSNTIKFANLNLENTLPKGFFVDTKYKSCVVTSLQKIVTPNDRKLLIDAANTNLSKKDSQYTPGRRKAYEVFRVFNNHRKNSTTKTVIRDFFRSIFKNFDEHIDWMMDNKNINIVLIVNREIFLQDKGLSINSIIGGALFAVHEQIGITINCVGIHFDYRYNSFGPILIHLCQVIGACQIELNSNGIVKNNYNVFLACQRNVHTFYKLIGFSEVKDYDIFKKGKEYEVLGKHMEIDAWKNAETPQMIMHNPRLCFRMINRVRIPNFNIENCLYDKTLIEEKQKSVEIPKIWDECVKETLQIHLSAIQNTEISKSILMSCHENGFFPSSLYHEAYSQMTLHKVGYLYTYAFNKFKEKKQTFKNYLMKACIPIMENLSLNIYQEVLEKERDNDDCWCEVQCLLCGKSCHVKNIHLEPMSAFLMKVVFSIWLKHVLAIAPKEDSMWDQAHPLWYICTERHGCYYESLKSAYISDLDKFARKNDNSDIAFFKYLEIFLQKYSETISKCQEEAAVYLSALYAEHQTFSPSETFSGSDKEDNEKKSYDESEKSTEKKITVNVDKKEPSIEKSATDSDSNEEEKVNKPETEKDRINSKANSNFVTNKNSLNDDSDDIPISSLVEISKEKNRNTANLTTKDGNLKDDTQENYNSDESNLSVEILNDFGTTENTDQILTDERLLKIENPVIKEKISQYKNLKRHYEEEDEVDPTVKSRREGNKGYNMRKRQMKKHFQKLALEIKTFILEENWYKQAKKDIAIQPLLHSIEYIDVSSRSDFPAASVKYLEGFSKMDNNEKQKMFEKETVPNYDNKNHFVMYYGENNKSIVVHENWFQVNTENFQGRRVNEKTVKTCKRHPNTIQKLKKSEKKIIKKNTDLCVDYREIERIERIKSTGDEALVFTHPDHDPNNHSIIKYKGYDSKSRTQYLPDSWLHLNFSHSPDIWRNIKNLNVGQQFVLPPGSSSNRNSWEKVNSQDRGPTIYYQQKNNSECLYYSLASAFHYMGHFGLVKMVLNEFELKKQSNQFPNIGNLVAILVNRKNQTFSNTKVKFMILKLSEPNAIQILDNKKKDILYHGVMRNNHSVAIYKSWIFDPIFPNAIRRCDHYLRFSAESLPYEDTKNIFLKVYSYTFIKEEVQY